MWVFWLTHGDLALEVDVDSCQGLGVSGQGFIKRKGFGIYFGLQLARNLSMSVMLLLVLSA